MLKIILTISFAEFDSDNNLYYNEHRLKSCKYFASALPYIYIITDMDIV